MSIKVYSTEWCGDCRRAKRFLSENDVAFEEINIERDKKAVRLVMKHNDGKRRIPTFEIDGSYYGNPSIPELAKLVGIPL